MPTRPVISTWTPVSSAVSRTAAAGSDSPRSIAPPGNAQLSLSARRIMRISPASLTTTTLADGTTLFALGAVGSSKKSMRPATAGTSFQRARAVPHAVEAFQVRGDHVASGDAPQVQHRRLGGREVVNVRVDHELVVGAVDRVVQDRAVRAELDAIDLTQRPVQDDGVTDAGRHRVAERGADEGIGDTMAAFLRKMRRIPASSGTNSPL